MELLEETLKLNILEDLRNESERTKDSDVAELYNSLETSYLNEKESSLSQEEYFDFVDVIRIQHDYSKARKLIQTYSY